MRGRQGSVTNRRFRTSGASGRFCSGHLTSLISRVRFSSVTYISATSRRIALCSLASALDAEAEEEVQAVIAALTRRRTSFVFAQASSSRKLRHCASTCDSGLCRPDRRAEDGRILENGTHGELMGRGAFLIRSECASRLGALARRGRRAALARVRQQPCEPAAERRGASTRVLSSTRSPRTLQALVALKTVLLCLASLVAAMHLCRRRGGLDGRKLGENAVCVFGPRRHEPGIARFESDGLPLEDELRLS